MKKCAVLLMIAVHASLAAAAHSARPEPQQKEQKQPEKKSEQPSKSLSKGYFSIFELLLSTPEPADTTKQKAVEPVKTN